MRLPPNMIQRSNGIYYVRVVVGGVQVWRTTGTRNLKEALGQYRRILGDIGMDGVRKPKRIPTVQEWWETYHETYSAAKRAPKRDREMIAPFLAKHGRLRLSNITQSIAARYLLDRAKTRIKYGPAKAPKYRTISSGTVSREHGFLQAFFERAIDEGYLEKNPFRKLPRAEFKTRERVLGYIEQETYLKRLSPKYQRWMIFMLATGIRLSECQKLDYWKDFNWDAGTFRVTGKFGKTREIPLPEPARAAVHDQYMADGELWKANQQRFREVLNEAAHKSPPLQPLNPHALRHTFATRYLQGGGDIYILSKILGHSSVTVTERVYAHLLKEDLVARSKGIDLKLPAKVLPFSKQVANK